MFIRKGGGRKFFISKGGGRWRRQSSWKGLHPASTYQTGRRKGRGTGRRKRKGNREKEEKGSINLSNWQEKRKRKGEKKKKSTSSLK